MRILLTAFDPYGEWEENSSWLTMKELLQDPPDAFELITRRYPVGLQKMKPKLLSDLENGFDAVLHLGQSPGISCIKLEAVAINFAGRIDDHGEELALLAEDGPVAFQSEMPLGRWANKLREEGIPASVSYHAGTFLCNATMYLTHHWHVQARRRVPVGFIHLPLAAEQVLHSPRPMASLPTSSMARGIRYVLNDLVAWTSLKFDQGSVA